ncbi:MAG: 1-deoxy-D-xylulose-5-phosphate reductoisomerase [SAR86 cluster bacterium]|uniref:1-deoxy-D-xylulose 5-phosphate reductoisomerase n=1 Tax=SAR86 cluster bacterium TaxID=2030880 RepID=A0A520N2H2_9GAMM|nr:MAG: 1-deoxy-D-xylulose-5-phosphate reductoisomerase [SAR86 cluster bacterium]
MKNILLLGATGSIGSSVLSVIEQNKNELNLIGISFNSNITKGTKIIEKFSPSIVHIENLNCFEEKKAFDTCAYINTESELNNLINHKEVDIIVCAISGFDGLKAAYMAAHSGKKILLGNKESIVAGGDLILPIAKENKTEIIPIDSEHNAIFQCLNGEKGTEDVKKIIITASGGPFINKSISDLKNVTVKEALAHPNWKMGNKVTIDSATLVNKCLELIEAKHLFSLDENYFDLVVHPQSIVHSIVTYIDGSSICQMSSPDMRVPIAHAMSDENRIPIDFNSLDFTSLNLSFQEFPPDRLEIQSIAREVCNKGSNYGVVFNAANEIAVESFINGKINFDKIYEVIYRTFDNKNVSKDLSIESINDIDMQTRIEAKKVVKSITN